MHAVVTGACGFVGRHLVAHLEASGDRVTGIDHVGDLVVDICDRDAIIGALGDLQPDVLYHLAARTHVGDSWSDPTGALRVNVEGTQNVLDACRRADVDRVLVIGSAEEYGLSARSGEPLGEDAPLMPATPYGASKVAAGFLALQAFLGEGLATVRVRAFNHTGPGQPARFVVPAFAQRITDAARTGQDHIMVGNLDTVRDWSDVRDVVRAYRLLVEHGTAGAVYNVASGRGVSIREIAHRLMALAGVELELRVDPALGRPADVPVLIGDPTQLRADTGYSATYSLDDTLRAVLDQAEAGSPQA